MKKYEKPVIEETVIEVKDVIQLSVAHSLSNPNDNVATDAQWKWD